MSRVMNMPASVVRDDVPVGGAEDTALWRAVAPLLERSTARDLLQHGVGALAAAHLRARGRVVPAELAREEYLAGIALMAVPPLLERIRASSEGPVVLFKGPEVARLYPGSARRFSDLDLLAPDARAVHRSLRKAGFAEVGDPRLYVGIHHLRPLRWPNLPLIVEVHSAPKWPEQLTPPTVEEIVEAATPSAVCAGVLAPDPHQHALLLAAHAWAHQPLHRLRDIVDVAAVAEGLDCDELDVRARAWGLRRLWRTTDAAVGCLLEGRPRTIPLRTWARHLPAVRERTVFENHLQRWVAAYWSLPPHRAVAAQVGAMWLDLRPAVEEQWSSKLARMRRAVRSAREPVSLHNEELGEAARRVSQKRTDG